MSLLRLFACGVAVSALWSAPVSAQQAEDGLRWRPLLGVGYSWGGDTITPVTIVPEGTSIEYQETIKAGTGIDVRTGIELAFPRSPFAVQLAVAYQNDGAAGLESKHMDFRRLPIELTGFWRVTPRFRVGLGVRKAAYAAFKASTAVCNEAREELDEPDLSCTTRYNSNVGLLAEAEYELTPQWAVRARYVRESYTPKRNSGNFAPDEDVNDYKVRGDHFGIISVWYLR
jgi:hypothetical protein